LGRIEDAREAELEAMNDANEESLPLVEGIERSSLREIRRDSIRSDDLRGLESAFRHGLASPIGIRRLRRETNRINAAEGTRR
jgi:hypothetical protein